MNDSLDLHRLYRASLSQSGYHQELSEFFHFQLENQRQEIEANHGFFRSVVASGQDVYGVTTGLGASSHQRFDRSLAANLQRNLMAYHGCGIGSTLSPNKCRAVFALRIHQLLMARSGIRPQLIEAMLKLWDAAIIPAIPSQGSVGASGDLTPLSYLAAAMAGERMAYHAGTIYPSAELLQKHQIEPYEFQDREVLAIMNGTTAMTAIAGLCWVRLERLGELSCLFSALLIELAGGYSAPFEPLLHQVKPHPGQQQVAAAIFGLLKEPELRLQQRSQDSQLRTIQDRYSLRCTPQILGAFMDQLEFCKNLFTTEINSISDNPVFLHDQQKMLLGGHFFGGHIAMGCDNLKAATATLANLMERQMAQLFDHPESLGLHENLVPPATLEKDGPIHHGFKAMQISLSSLSAEICQNTMPSSVFSRPTEANNQDVVSMGTMAACSLQRVVGMAEDCAAIAALCLTQALHLRQAAHQPVELSTNLLHETQDWLAEFPITEYDRPLDQDINSMREYIFS